MKKLKIVVIGGGSSYTPELVEGLLQRRASLPLKELWLVDIEEGKRKVEIIADLARRMVKREKADIIVHVAFNRQEALQDADFVITQFRVGFLEARLKDETIPLSLGMIGQETNGAGGMFKAMRTIPVMKEIVADIKKHCPQAWLINFTNPAGLVTEAIRNDLGFERVIGLCNNPINMKYAVAQMLKTETANIRLEFQGLNHHNFISRVFLNDLDVSDSIYQSLASGEIEKIDLPFSREYLLGIKAIPNDYLKYYVDTGEVLKVMLSDYKNGKIRSMIVKEVEEKLFVKYADPELDVKPEELSKRGGARYSEAACQLIDSIYNDRRDVQYVNTRNNGAVSNFAKDNVIECACIISKNGAEPLPIGEFDIKFLGTITNIKSFERMTIEAVLEADRNLAIAALAMNPLVPDEKSAAMVFDELYKAHGRYLPEFK